MEMNIKPKYLLIPQRYYLDNRFSAQNDIYLFSFYAVYICMSFITIFVLDSVFTDRALCMISE